MSSNFFSQALRNAMNERHFNQAQLADFLKVDPAYVSRWLKGSSPRIQQMREALTKLGWDIERARPDYDPFSDAMGRVESDASGPGKGRKGRKAAAASVKDPGELSKFLQEAAETHRIVNTAAVPLIGTVSAEGAAVKVSKDPEATFDTVATMFPEVNFAENEVSFLRVTGRELEPAFHDGDLLAVRRVLQPQKAPDGCLVVFSSGKRSGASHLRRLIRVADRSVTRVERLIGIPLVPGQDFLFFKPREVSLAWVVVGVISFQS